jgi:magnesium chelatase family protein
MRAYGRILRVARTIADLEGSERVGVEHVAEALSYRVGHDSAAAARTG